MTATEPRTDAHTATNRPSGAPTDFAYWEALDRPSITRARRLCQRVLRFDPVPDARTVAALAQDMHSGDPVAERFVDEVFFGPDGYAAGRRLLDRALEHGIDAIPDAPAAMRELFAEFETIPDWVDPALVERGAAVWRRWGTDLFAVAGAGTLEMYTESAVALPLAFAGGYAGDKALNRFLETARFWIDVSTPGALLSPAHAAGPRAAGPRDARVGAAARGRAPGMGPGALGPSDQPGLHAAHPDGRQRWARDRDVAARLPHLAPRYRGAPALPALHGPPARRPRDHALPHRTP